MGHRLTFYKCPNECAERFRHTTYDDFEFSTDDFEEMFYDITNWIYFDEFKKLCENNEEDKIWSKLFDDIPLSDVDYKTINKEQMFNLINMIRRFILSENKHFDIFELDKKIRDVSDKDRDKLYEDARKIIIDKNFETDIFYIYYNKPDEDFLNELDKKPYMVYFGSTWMSALINFIYVYKTFDWENNCILVYGG